MVFYVIDIAKNTTINKIKSKISEYYNEKFIKIIYLHHSSKILGKLMHILSSKYTKNN